MPNTDDMQKIIFALETKIVKMKAEIAQLRQENASKARVIAYLRANEIDGINLKTVETGHGNSEVYQRDNGNPLSFDDYQKQAATTAMYPNNRGLEYCIIGLIGEAGELANKYKKVIRGDYTEDAIRDALADELSDCIWYTAMIATELNKKLGDIAQGNLDKLASRKERGTIKGSGDNR